METQFNEFTIPGHIVDPEDFMQRYATCNITADGLQIIRSERVPVPFGCIVPVIVFSALFIMYQAVDHWGPAGIVFRQSAAWFIGGAIAIKIIGLLLCARLKEWAWSHGRKTVIDLHSGDIKSIYKSTHLLMGRDLTEQPHNADIICITTTLPELMDIEFVPSSISVEEFRELIQAHPRLAQLWTVLQEVSVEDLPPETQDIINAIRDEHGMLRPDASDRLAELKKQLRQ